MEFYYTEWGNPIKKEHTWYGLTDKWVLSQKLGIPKIQFTQTTWNSRRKTKVWILQAFLEGGTKYPWEELQSVEEKLKERLPRDCSTWGSIPYTTIKPRHYCGCQQVLADRSLLYLSPESLYQCLTNTEVDAHSHPLDGAEGPQWRSQRKYTRSWRGLQPHRRNNNMN